MSRNLAGTVLDMKRKLLATTTAASILLAAFGLIVLFRFRYRAPLSRVEQMAAAIPGVVVVDSGGNRDVTLQDLWLDLEFRGHMISLVNVTEESFRGGGKLDVAAFDRWRFACRGFAAGANPQTERAVRNSGFLEFGRDGLMSQELLRAPRSVRELLERIEEVEAVILYRGQILVDRLSRPLSRATADLFDEGPESLREIGDPFEFPG